MQAEKIIFGKYKTETKLGEGSFGKIYSALNIQTGEKFALKFEDRKNSHNLLEELSCISGSPARNAASILLEREYGWKHQQAWNTKKMQGKEKKVSSIGQDKLIEKMIGKYK